MRRLKCGGGGGGRGGGGEYAGSCTRATRLRVLHKVPGRKTHLTGAGGGPVPEGGGLEAVLLGEGKSVGVREGGGGSLLGELVAVATLLLDSGGENSGVELEVGGLDPVGLDLLELGTVLAGGLGLHHEVNEGAEVRVGGAEDERVVAGVNVGGDEGSGLRVGTGDDEVGGAHDVALETDGNETVDVLRNGDKDLSGHVTTLLGARGLVLDVDTGGTGLDHHLGELHDSGETTVAGVTVGDDGAEVVDLGAGVLALGDGGGTGKVLLAVVEKLGSEELGNLVGDSVGRVVGKIGSGLERAGSGRGALPAGDVDGLEVLGHLGDLDGVETATVLEAFFGEWRSEYSRAVGEGAAAALTTLLGLEDLPELLGHGVRGVGDGERATLGDDVGGRVGADGALEAGLLRCCQNHDRRNLARGTHVLELVKGANLLLESLDLGRRHGGKVVGSGGGWRRWCKSRGK